MSYDDYDKSVHGAAPVECFKFIGELNTYRYTNNNEPLTVDGEVYVPLSGITRGALETSPILDSIQTIDVNLPITCDLAVAYNFLNMPLTLDLEIRSVHRGSDFAVDWKLIWQGESVSFPVSENKATVKTQSIVQASLGRQLNQITFGTPCNHFVYDSHCTLDPADFKTTTTVTDIKGNVITVADDGFADAALAIGQAINLRTSETRTIISNVANVLTLGYPFIDVVEGDTVDLVRGCDKTYTMCHDVFDNLLNFGGFKFLPETNPYIDPV